MFYRYNGKVDDKQYRINSSENAADLVKDDHGYFHGDMNFVNKDQIKEFMKRGVKIIGLQLDSAGRLIEDPITARMFEDRVKNNQLRAKEVKKLDTNNFKNIKTARELVNKLLKAGKDVSIRVGYGDNIVINNISIPEKMREDFLQYCNLEEEFDSTFGGWHENGIIIPDDYYYTNYADFEHENGDILITKDFSKAVDEVYNNYYSLNGHTRYALADFDNGDECSISYMTYNQHEVGFLPWNLFGITHASDDMFTKLAYIASSKYFHEKYSPFDSYIDKPFVIMNERLWKRIKGLCDSHKEEIAKKVIAENIKSCKKLIEDNKDKATRNDRVVLFYKRLTKLNDQIKAGRVRLITPRKNENHWFWNEPVEDEYLAGGVWRGEQIVYVRGLSYDIDTLVSKRLKHDVRLHVRDEFVDKIIDYSEATKMFTVDGKGSESLYDILYHIFSGHDYKGEMLDHVYIYAKENEDEVKFANVIYNDIAYDLFIINKDNIVKIYE